MATILAFKPASPDRSAAPAQAAASCPASTKAELIFFPGVRYERVDTSGEIQSHPAPQRERKNSRRTRQPRSHDLIDLMD